ncbi:hypothetical protein NOR_08218 [Metarhizium rileyi]|uniref:Uncharacterized protein n=1 Tax=Metarhizium rileyi (strain RCEF 4871) TaxID=1649241 RepID=A0A166WQ60_METRR|nr:hypothetical protein NOR_08218 [Metarhizium rileyi RCEF 4871]
MNDPDEHTHSQARKRRESRNPQTPSSPAGTSSRSTASLPASPTESMARVSLSPTQPQPPDPKPWSWECPGCDHVYRFAVTTRCLHCGYRVGRDRGRIRAEGPGESRPPRECTSYFDYTGWEARSIWAKQVRESRARTRGGTAHGDESPGLKAGQRHCFFECHYPAACYGELLFALELDLDNQEDREVLVRWAGDGQSREH